MAQRISRFEKIHPTKSMITLHFVEEVMYGKKAETHAGGRIEIWEDDKENYTEEIHFLLPRKMYEEIKKELDFKEIETTSSKVHRSYISTGTWDGETGAHIGEISKECTCSIGYSHHDEDTLK